MLRYQADIETGKTQVSGLWAFCGGALLVRLLLEDGGLHPTNECVLWTHFAYSENHVNRVWKSCSPEGVRQLLLPISS
jgi:hypothetical protein